MNTTHLPRAMLWMMGAVLSFSTMIVAGRAVSAELDTFELMFYRSVLSLIVIQPFIWKSLAGYGGLMRVRHRNHLLRNTIHFAGQNLWFYSIATIPLAQVVVLEFTNPIWVALLAPLLLAEHLTKTRLASVLLGFAGIVIVAQPGSATLGLGHLAALSAAVFFALTNIVTKRLTRTNSLLSIIFWMTLTQAVLGFICAAPGGIAFPSPPLYPWMIVLAGGALGAHLCLTKALGLAPAVIVGPMDFLRLPVIAVAGMLLYGEPLQAAVFIGGGVIIAGNLLNLFFERKRQKASA